MGEGTLSRHPRLAEAISSLAGLGRIAAVSADIAVAMDGGLLPPATVTRRHLSAADELALSEQIGAEHEAGEKV